MSKKIVVHWLRGAIISLSAAAIVISCGVQDASKIKSEGKAPINGAFPSLETLAQAVLQAIEDSSYDAIMNCRVTEQEYRDVLWAGLPKEELVNYPLEKAWASVEQDCIKTARRMLFDLGGRHYDLLKVYVAKETREYPTLKVIRGLRMIVRDESGETTELNMLNVVLEVNNTYKVIAYNS